MQNPHFGSKIKIQKNMSKSTLQIIIFKIISFLENFLFFAVVSLQGTTLNDFSEWILTFFSNFNF